MSKWISVSDRLPPYYEHVLCMSEGEICLTWYASDGDNEIWTVAYEEETLIDVTHWMPLPNPPTE